MSVVCIDPPYNTGNEFIYPDKFSESLETYFAYTGQVDAEGRKFSTNTEADGRFHSKWLNMMYPRLFLARNLLRDDGVIFISIDANEVKNLRSLCDEIFGEENYVECISWNKRIPKNDKGIGNIHEYVLIYVKNCGFKHVFTMPKDGLDEINVLLNKLQRTQTPIPQAEQELRKFYRKKGYDRGITLYNSLNSQYELWGKINVSWPNAETFGPRYDVAHPKTQTPVKVPDRGWRWKKIELHDGSYICGEIWFDKDENTQPSLIKFLKDLDKLLLRSIISLKSDGGIEVEKIFEGKNFYSYPKPTSLIKILIESIPKDDSIVLDFFAGSCTTANSVLDLNKEDARNRKFIMVQLPEPCNEKTEAFKSGYKTIADIGKERIRKVIKKIEKERDGKLDFGEPKQDLGFKVFKLDKSNFKIWDGSIANKPIQEQLKLAIDHIDPNSKEEDILYEILLKSGFELTTPVEELTLEGKKVYSVAEEALLICLEKNLTKDLVRAIAEKEPHRVVCLDSGFKGNDQLKTNAVQIMKSFKVESFRTV
jgi:adenine-specific DNA-methyltransferase